MNKVPGAEEAVVPVVEAAAPVEDHDPYINVRQAAMIAGVSVELIVLWAHNNWLKSRRREGCVQIEITSLREKLTPELYFTSGRCAEITGVKKDRLYDWASRGRVRSIAYPHGEKRYYLPDIIKGYQGLLTERNEDDPFARDFIFKNRAEVVSLFQKNRDFLVRVTAQLERSLAK